jgi:hypothetical protein
MAERGDKTSPVSTQDRIPDVSWRDGTHHVAVRQEQSMRRSYYRVAQVTALGREPVLLEPTTGSLDGVRLQPNHLPPLAVRVNVDPLQPDPCL